MKKSIVLIPLPSLIKNSFVRSWTSTRIARVFASTRLSVSHVWCRVFVARAGKRDGEVLGKQISQRVSLFY